jgi:ABC-type polar amino acid transport system ATPase subunit
MVVKQDRADRAEQAARATIRQVMLEQHLGSIPGMLSP